MCGDQGFHHHPHSDHHASEEARERAVLQPELGPGAGRGKLLFLDAFSGIAGDMLVAALLDLGVPRPVLDEALAALSLEGYTLRFPRRIRNAISAAGFDVEVAGAQPMRDYASIRALLEGATGLSAGTRELALRAFGLLAEVEAKLHGTSVERVHFHEVGAVDSIVDIVAAAAALDYLGARLMCSPLPMGRGFVATQHGMLPNPAPATLLCLQGVPTYDAGIDAELVTPTGAALVRCAASAFTRWPSMRPERCGFGAGVREFRDRPNLLRVVLGDALPELPQARAASSHAVLELNVDDMTGEFVAAALARVMHAGALDAWSTPIGMKKGRPALMLSALVERAQMAAIARVLLGETTSLGLRVREVDRIERSRRIVQVETEFGPIDVKVADGDGLPTNIKPEYEDCRRAAERWDVPLKHVYAAALGSYLGSSHAARA